MEIGQQNEWIKYSKEDSLLLEKAFQGTRKTSSSKKKEVKIDDARFVDINDKVTMYQRRYDDPDKKRAVKREEEDNNNNKKKATAKKRKGKQLSESDEEDATSKKSKATNNNTNNTNNTTTSNNNNNNNTATTTTSTENWEVQPWMPPADVMAQHAKEAELYQKYMTNPDVRAKCNTLINGPDATGG